MRSLRVVTIGAALAARLGAQAFQPPSVQRASLGGTRIGLLGFGVRGGIDANYQRQFVFAVALDAGNLVTSRLRIRPSAEIGLLNGANTYAGAVELLYRFTGDDEAATPYAGGGLALAGHAACGSDPSCPALWVNAVLGVEVRYRSTFNWLVEYHAMDAFRHNRLYVGLTTRRGS
jgi:hypothetical protein